MTDPRIWQAQIDEVKDAVRALPAKPLKHFCICGRGFTTSSGAKHHYAACPQEQARSANVVAWMEGGYVGPRPTR